MPLSPLDENENRERLTRAGKLLELIAADTKRRAQAESKSSERLAEAAKLIQQEIDEVGTSFESAHDVSVRRTSEDSEQAHTRGEEDRKRPDNGSGRESAT